MKKQNATTASMKMPMMKEQKAKPMQTMMRKVMGKKH